MKLTGTLLMQLPDCLSFAPMSLLGCIDCYLTTLLTIFSVAGSERWKVATLIGALTESFRNTLF